MLCSKKKDCHTGFGTSKKNGTFLVVGGDDPFKDLFKNAFELPLY